MSVAKTGKLLQYINYRERSPAGRLGRRSRHDGRPARAE